MKKYIKAATQHTYTSYSPEWIEKRLRALKQDRRNLARCESIEDLDNYEWLSWRVKEFILMDMEKGLTFDDVVDNMMNDFNEEIKSMKEEYEQSVDYRIWAETYMNMLDNQLSEEYETSGVNPIIITPPEDASHQDCIAFVDHIVDLIHGKYIQTGRGGSWSAWNLISGDGIQFKAGWTRDDKWFVEAEI